MALSGSFYTNVGAHWRLQLEWTGKQSISGNYTDVTAKLYWIALDGYGAVYSSDTKTCSITISGSSSSKSASKMAALSGNQKKLIHSYTKRIYHDDDGTGSVTLDGYFDAEVTLGGTYYGRINLTAHTYTLNTIPRKSSLTSSKNFTAGSNITVTVSRKSSSFTHRVYIDVADSGGTYRNIKSINFSTSASTSFSVSENTDIFRYLNGRSSTQVRWNLHTYDSDGNDIGYNTYYGTVTAPSASTAKITNPTGVSDASGQGDSTVWIDQTISLSITRANSNFTHTVRFKDSNSGSILKEFTNVGTSVSWTPTATEQQTLYAKTPNANEFDGQVDIYTYYNGVQVRSATAMDINYRVRNSNPEFGTGYTYKDTNSSTVAITNNDQYIIQGKSNVLVELPVTAKATAVNKATMAKYIASLAGKTVTKTYSDTATVTFDFGTIDASEDQTLTIKAVDSRGNSTTTSIRVKVIPYKEPYVYAVASRVNGFEDETHLGMLGTFSGISISGNTKNTITSIQYRYKQSNVSTWGSWIDIPFSIVNVETFLATQQTLNLNNLFSWNIEVKVVDKLTTKIVPLTVDTGKPIFFIDTLRKSLGFGDFPNDDNQFLMNGRITFGSTIWNDTGGIGEGKGAIELNNSDITQANAIWFYDLADINNGEGLLFLKPGKTSGSTDKADYDNLLVNNGTLYLNGNPIGLSSQEELWSGAAYMTANQTITPSKPLSKCPNGWILIWSDYDPGVGSNDYNWAFSIIPKSFIKYGSSSVFFVVPNYVSSTSLHITIKTFNITDTQLTGNDANNSTDIESNDVVLRKVLAF